MSKLMTVGEAQVMMQVIITKTTEEVAADQMIGSNVTRY